MKKLLEMLRKLLSSSKSSEQNKGFTLIELLIVIAILGILAAGLLVAIDPAEKIRQGGDSRAIADVTGTASKLEQWAIANNGTYPANQNAANTAVGIPVNANYTYVYTYTAATNTFTFRVNTLRSEKYTNCTGVGCTATPRFIYDSAQGKTCFVATTATVCP